ncbi:long-chain-fatty-acid--CoA ligase [bacterium BMS3Abin05]|nr:long-chain-fatty-acid--CoA ligase [bacterium BMS3Abin05]GBE26925.1 long-chain-fatty-acid--CoA ligase [bacterium BMS3Bbin03]
MMNYPLTLTNLLKRGTTLFPQKEIVSRELDGTIVRLNYGEFYRRTAQLANALRELGITKNKRVGTLAWNTHRHLELYFAVPCMGATYHTVNIRLSPKDIIFIINHAEDEILFIDGDLLPLLEAIKNQIQVKTFVVMGNQKKYNTTLSLINYEDLIAKQPENYDWPELDEWDIAGMAYTSGTTGEPKGVQYTHRALVLHSIVAGLPDIMNISESTVMLHIVPMFHANAWSIPFATVMTGSKQVFTGPRATPEDMIGLIEREKVTFTAAVPVIFRMLYEYLKANPGKDISTWKNSVCGGSAPPPSLVKAFKEDFDMEIYHAYGLTETTPLITWNVPKSYMKLDDQAFYDLKTKQGLLVPLLEMRIEKSDGSEAKWNGEEMGELLVKGPWIAKEYYKDPDETFRKMTKGWFRTGDIVTIDKEGYIKIVDRIKDVIKTGGEWISSVDLENEIMAHPAVLEATVIGLPHPKWDERPLACVVLRPGMKGKVSEKDIVDFITPKFAKWWLPDKVIFIDEIPKTSVGKFDKKVLRAQFENLYQKDQE